MSLPRRARTKSFLADAWPSLLVAAVYLSLSLRFTRFRGVFEMDPDEGNNLIKALLLDQGHAFLRDIWSDQPPLFAYVLWGLFKVLGFHVSVAREAVLVTSALLVFAVYDSVFLTLRRGSGPLAAHVGAAASIAALLLGSSFAVLRVSVMIGLPAISLAALAVWAALRAAGADGLEREPKLRARWLFAAGALLGLSVATKLFTAFLLPVVFGAALAPELASLLSRRRPPLLAVVWFTAGLAIAFLIAISPALGSGAASELLLTHLGGRELGYRSKYDVWSFIVRDAVTFGLASAGVVLAIARKHWSALPWVVWLVLSLIALRTHNPLWAHHNQLLLIPAVALTGIFVGGIAGLLPPRFRPIGAVGAGVAAATALALSVGDRLEKLEHPRTSNDSREQTAMEEMRRLDVKTGYIVTSRPIYAFYLGLPVPPSLSVTSAKRFRAGRLDDRTIVDQVHKYRAELVIVSRRWPTRVRDRVRRALRPDYESVYRDSKNNGLEVLQRRHTDRRAVGPTQ